MDTDTSRISDTNQRQKGSNEQRILTIDDEPAILFAYQKFFEWEGYLVDLCETLDQSIKMIEMHLYFAVISDIRIGGTDNKDGIKILRFIREKRPDTKVILISGDSDNSIVQTGLNPDATYFFKKPVKPSVILDVVNSLSDS